MGIDLIETALQIALSVHAGQRDKAGQLYILHPLRVMAKLHTDEERATALLHDVIEDRGYDLPQLLQAGMVSCPARGRPCCAPGRRAVRYAVTAATARERQRAR